MMNLPLVEKQMISRERIMELAVVPNGYTAKALAQLLQNIPEHPGFDPGTISFHIPRTKYSEIENYVKAAVVSTVYNMLPELLKIIRDNERERLLTRLRGQ